MNTSAEQGQPNDLGVADTVRALVDGLTAAVSFEPGEVSIHDLGGVLVAVAEAIGRLEAAECRLLDDFARQGGPGLDGARSAGAWLAARSETSSTAARSSEKRGRILRDCPTVAAAYEAGELGTAKVRIMLDARDGLEERFAHDEAELVRHLAPLRVRHARIVMARWRELALGEQPSSPDDAPPDPEADNSLTVALGFEGNRIITGNLDALSGAEFQAILDAEVDAGFRTGRFHAGDGLTAGRRRAIAHLDLLRRGAAAPGAGGVTRRNIQVIVHVDIGTLLGLPAGSTSALLAQRCELDDGTIVSLARVLEAGADATINTILGHLGLDGRFHPVGEITNQRLASDRQRRFLACRDRTCAFPGCDQPARWSQAHHVDGWNGTHQTSVSRLSLLCRFHHHSVVHADNGITYDTAVDGSPTVTRADRSVIPTPAHGHKLDLTPSPPDHPPPEPNRSASDPTEPASGRRDPPRCGGSAGGPIDRDAANEPIDRDPVNLDIRLARAAARCLRRYRRLIEIDASQVTDEDLRLLLDGASN